MSKDSTQKNAGVRIDKWLWAARFFKTRGLAKTAVDTGKVTLDGNRLKPSRDAAIGMLLCIHQSWDEKTVEIIGLANQRRGAPEAAALYAETPESIKKREAEVENRRMQATLIQPKAKPDKNDRRARSQFKHQSE
jgi:ribosome-associated heat shock protein Hsp15